MCDNNIKEVRVFANGMAFPVLLFVCDDKQHDFVMRLAENVRVIYYRTEDICQWAATHGVEYTIFVSRLDRLLPWRRLKYHQIIKSS